MVLHFVANQHPYTIGFGNFGETSHPLIGDRIEITVALLNAYVFYTARSGIITDFGASMMAMENLDLGYTGANVYMQVFQKVDTPYFIAIPETKVVLTPSLTGSVQAGDLFENTLNNLNVPIAAGTRIMVILHKDMLSPDAQEKSLLCMMSASLYID